MGRSEPYMQGFRAGIREAIRFLEHRAKQMIDQRATGVLHSAAFELGNHKEKAMTKEFLTDLSAATSHLNHVLEKHNLIGTVELLFDHRAWMTLNMSIDGEYIQSNRAGEGTLCGIKIRRSSHGAYLSHRP